MTQAKTSLLHTEAFTFTFLHFMTQFIVMKFEILCHFHHTLLNLYSANMLHAHTHILPADRQKFMVNNEHEGWFSSPNTYTPLSSLSKNPKMMFNKARTIEIIFLPNIFRERLGEQTLKQEYHHPTVPSCPPPISPLSKLETISIAFKRKKNYALTTYQVSHKEENHWGSYEQSKTTLSSNRMENKLSLGRGVAMCGHLQHVDTQV